MWFTKKHKIGLVLGGGGARGFFHMGVIKGIQELGIEINEISGTSIGAIISLIYAANPKIDFERVSNEFGFSKIIQSMMVGGKIKVDMVLEKLLKNYIKAETFEELKIKTKINSTDINNNQEVIFDKGNIFPGVIASISIPGVFPPLKYENKFLVDGGVINNVPISLIEKADKIIVSDICGPIKKVGEKSIPGDILYTSIALMQRNLSLQKTDLSDSDLIYLTLNDDQTFILDFRKKNYQYLINLGYRAIMERKNRF